MKDMRVIGVWASPNCAPYSNAYRSEGGKAVTQDRREERQQDADKLVKACKDYAEHVKAPWFLENPWTGCLKGRPTGVFIKTQRLTIRLEILCSQSL